MRKLKNIIMVFVCLQLCFFTTVQVSAANPDGHVCSHGYHTFSDHKMSHGVGNYGNNRRYYWTTGFSSTYNSYISKAVNEWVNTSPGGPNVTTSISIRKTNTRSSAMFEFHNKYLGANILGRTHFYLYSNEIALTSGTLTKDYGWSLVEISVKSLTNHSISANQCKGTIAHELGHAMGLSHQNNRRAGIMCQTAYSRTATRADAKDCKTINHIYG